MAIRAQLALDARASLGEGACWCEQQHALYWVDITGCALHIYRPDVNTDEKFDMPRMVGTCAPAANGRVLLAMEDGFYVFTPASRALTKLCDPEGRRDNRFNDGKCDPAGRFLAGTCGLTHNRPEGALYRMDADLSTHVLETGIGTSNGLCFGDGGRVLYYIDTPTRRVDAYDYDLKTGAATGRRAVLEFDDAHGWPDGMTIDDDGHLWVAEWGGSRVGCWDVAARRMIDEIPIPALHVTSCAFAPGGALYITTAINGDTAPHAGSLFVAQTRTTGAPAYVFSGPLPE